jgi:hypothetical protein
MKTCPQCGSAMVYRFNLNWARSPLGSEYAWFCVTDPTHFVEDLSRFGTAS